MMNKLAYAHRIILKPYVDALKNTSSDDSLRRIQARLEDLQKELIEKITVFVDHFTVEFKSGITIDIEA